MGVYGGRGGRGKVGILDFAVLEQLWDHTYDIRTVGERGVENGDPKLRTIGDGE